MYAAQLTAFLLTVTTLVVVVLAMGWAQHLATARRTARRNRPASLLPLPYTATTEGVDPAPGRRAEV